MIITDCLRRINFRSGTLDDISNKSINKLFTNQQIIDELNTQLGNYSRITKGIQDVYSFPLAQKTPFVQAPPYALRSESYHFIGYISKGTIFGMDMRNAPEVYNTFRYSPMAGMSNWIMPWSSGNTQYLSVFPMTGTNPLSTTLNGSITASGTTITVVNTDAYVNNHGRVSIDSEKILYTYKDATHFYGCQRGMEMTTAAIHNSGATVTENNIFLHYSRISAPIVINSDDTIPTTVGNTVLDPCEEHMLGIIDAVAYQLIRKYDANRADAYKVDWKELYAEYQLEILRGYYSGRSGAGVREQFPNNESGVPMGSNLLY